MEGGGHEMSVRVVTGLSVSQVSCFACPDYWEQMFGDEGSDNLGAAEAHNRLTSY